MKRRAALLCAVLAAGCFEPESEAIGPAGGTVSFDGVTLVVPVGALEESVLFTATRAELPPSAPRAAGPAFVFGPEGLEFKKPVELRLRLDDPASRAQILTAARVTGPWTRVPTVIIGGVAVASVSHFSVFYPSEPDRSDAGLDAGVDAGVHAGLDAGLDAGVEDAGIDAGMAPDAGLDGGAQSCTLPCWTGFACDLVGGFEQCVFGYERMLITQPTDGGLVDLQDGGFFDCAVTLVPKPGLLPVPPASLQSTLSFVISFSNEDFLPVADGGPYVARFSTVPGPHELWVYTGIRNDPTRDAGITIFQDRVNFTTQ